MTRYYFFDFPIDLGLIVFGFLIVLIAIVISFRKGARS